MSERIIAVHFRENPESGCIEEHDVPLGPNEYETWNSKTGAYDITPRDRLSEGQIKSIEDSRDDIRVAIINTSLGRAADLGALL